MLLCLRYLQKERLFVSFIHSWLWHWKAKEDGNGYRMECSLLAPCLSLKFLSNGPNISPNIYHSCRTKCWPILCIVGWACQTVPTFCPTFVPLVSFAAVTCVGFIVGPRISRSLPTMGERLCLTTHNGCEGDDRTARGLVNIINPSRFKNF